MADSDHSESRTRRKIRKAIEARGWTIIRMEWEPISAGAEKSGPEGGWYIEARAPSGGMDWVLGYNVAQVLDWLAEFIPDDKTSPLGIHP